MKSSWRATLFYFPAKKQLVLMTRYCGGEEIKIATFFQFQAFPEFGYRHREITYSDIRFIDASKSGFQFTLVHRSGFFDGEPTAREVADVDIGHE